MARQVRITHLGGGDAWTHPVTGATHKPGDFVAHDEHTAALVEDGWAERAGTATDWLPSREEYVAAGYKADTYDAFVASNGTGGVPPDTVGGDLVSGVATKTCATCGVSWTGVGTPDVCPECGGAALPGQPAQDQGGGVAATGDGQGNAGAPAGSTAPDAEFDDKDEDADEAADEEADASAAAAKPKRARKAKA